MPRPIFQNTRKTESVYESITVGSAAVSLGRKDALEAFITVEDASINYRLDGVEATAGEGHKLAAGEALFLKDDQPPQAIRKFSAIRSASQDAKIKVTYKVLV